MDPACPSQEVAAQNRTPAELRSRVGRHPTELKGCKVRIPAARSKEEVDLHGGVVPHRIASPNARSEMGRNAPVGQTPDCGPCQGSGGVSTRRRKIDLSARARNASVMTTIP